MKLFWNLRNTLWLTLILVLGKNRVKQVKWNQLNTKCVLVKEFALTKELVQLNLNLSKKISHLNFVESVLNSILCNGDNSFHCISFWPYYNLIHCCYKWCLDIESWHTMNFLKDRHFVVHTSVFYSFIYNKVSFRLSLLW